MAASLAASIGKLRSLVENVPHPKALGGFLEPVEASAHNRAKYFVWRGTTTKAKARGVNFVRCIVQYQWISSPDRLLLIVRLATKDHVRYEHYREKLRGGSVADETHQVELVQPQKNLRQFVNWRIPGSLAPPDPPESYAIEEGNGIPESLSADDLLDAIRLGGPAELSTETEIVVVTQNPSGSWNLRVQGDDGPSVRRYDVRSVNDHEKWKSIRETSGRADVDPCLILSKGERELLAGFAAKNVLPARIDGSAGSGKTTLLSLSLARLVTNSNHQGLPSPLFVTLNDRLRTTAVERLIHQLVVHEHFSRTEAEESARRCCRTFGSLLTELTEIDMTVDVPDRFAKLARDEWREFRRWWGEGYSKHTSKPHPEAAYRFLRMYVFGRLPDDRGPTDDEIQDIERHMLRTQRVHDTDSLALEDGLRIWEDFRRNGRRSNLHDLIATARERLLANGETFCRWGYILCDEVQDFGPQELEILMLLSQFSHLSEEREGKRDQFPVREATLPLVVAGDEFQSIHPSGFTFERFEEFARSFLDDIAFAPTPFFPPKRLNENFRSVDSIVQIGTACRKMLSSTIKGKTVRDMLVHRTPPYPTAFGVHQVDASTVSRAEINRLLTLPGIVVLVPNKDLIESDFPNSRGHVAILTPEEAKGLEFSSVILWGFADVFPTSLEESRLRLFLIALNIAVTRARDQVYFLDSNGNMFWRALAEHGGIGIVPPLSGFDVLFSVSLDSQITNILSLAEGAIDDLCDESISEEEFHDRVRKLLVMMDECSGQKIDSTAEQRLARTKTTLQLLTDVLDPSADVVSAEQWRWLLAGREQIARFVARRASNRGGRIVDEFPFAADSLSRPWSTTFAAELACRDTTKVDSEAMCDAVALLGSRLFEIALAAPQNWRPRTNPDLARHWKEVRKQVLSNPIRRKPTEREKNLLEATAAILKQIDPEDPLISVLLVRNAIGDDAQMESRMTEANVRLEAADREVLLEEVALGHYGLDWIPDAFVDTEIKPLMRRHDFETSDLIRVLRASSSPLRAGSEERFAELLARFDPTSIETLDHEVLCASSFVVGRLLKALDQ